MTNLIPKSWSPARQRAAQWFIADITRKARMMSKPDEIDVKVDVSGSGQLSVRAQSALYDAFGCCFIGPRGGINHRRDMLHLKV